MFITSLIGITLALVFLYTSKIITDEIVRLAVKLTALFLLLCSVTFAPLLIKLLIFMTLLITEKPTFILNKLMTEKPTSP